MRLLHTTTFELSEFHGSNIPFYAILSHRWEESEVTFQDLRLEGHEELAGWAKVAGACNQAKVDGWEYAWIDTCCIDNSSSAELSEAINSMFRWYREAQVCYAYLCDVPAGNAKQYHLESNSALSTSQWFTRGWTLQELLAPDTVVFFDSGWIEVGTKFGLASIISDVTGIETKFLHDFNMACIAQKMSWASRRRTLREEDMAYCLLGLFGVQMPLLYGEGKKAFMRLQLEILKISQDESMFAWIEDTPCEHPRGAERRRGLLAQAPTSFRNSGDVFLSRTERQSPCAMTNRGLQIEMELFANKRSQQATVRNYYYKLENAGYDEEFAQ